MGGVGLDADCLAEGPLVEQLFQRDLLPADDLAADVDHASQGVLALYIQGSKPTDKRKCEDRFHKSMVTLLNYFARDHQRTQLVQYIHPLFAFFMNCISVLGESELIVYNGA
jgi:hypothetical protein